MNWSDHVLLGQNKAAKSIEILNKARKVLSQRPPVSMYYTFVYPYFINCIDVWGSASENMLSSLFKTQKIAMRLITSPKRNSHT